jgi:hypothetical protein
VTKPRRDLNTAHTPPTRTRIMRAFLTSIIGALLASIFAVAPADAATCYGDYCSGKDPQATGCAADARTVAHVRDAGGGYILELRWSPSCKTNWARISKGSISWIKAVQPSTGYTQWGNLTTPGSPFVWSRQIYSPTRCVYGSSHITGWQTIGTACV